jgi:hypothetical protein
MPAGMGALACLSWLEPFLWPIRSNNSPFPTAYAISVITYLYCFYLFVMVPGKSPFPNFPQILTFFFLEEFIPFSTNVIFNIVMVVMAYWFWFGSKGDAGQIVPPKSVSITVTPHLSIP